MSGFHLKIMRSLSILYISVPGITIGLSLILVLFRYESSGYDYSATSAPSPHNYSSFRQVYTSSPGQSGQSSSHRSNFSYHSETELNPTNGSGNDSSIEAGPSFNESLQRFKTASGHNAQVASWKNQVSPRTGGSHTSHSSHVQRRVEETRTMIPQSSQKSYHLE